MDELKLVGLLVEGGSFALLCFVARWVTVWVPKRIERADQVREAEAKPREAVAESTRLMLTEQRHAHAEEVRRLLAEAAEQLKYEREACDRKSREVVEAIDRRQAASEKWYDDLVERLEAQHTLDREIKHEVANLAQSEANRRALEELKQRKGAKP